MITTLQKRSQMFPNGSRHKLLQARRLAAWEQAGLACMCQASERAARVGLGGQLRPAHADPRAAVVRMHDGAEAGIGPLTQLAGRAALLMPPRATADC